MKDGRTHMAHKAEHAVDLETGAVLGMTTTRAGPTGTSSAPVHHHGDRSSPRGGGCLRGDGRADHEVPGGRDAVSPQRSVHPM